MMRPDALTSIGVLYVLLSMLTLFLLARHPGAAVISAAAATVAAAAAITLFHRRWPN